MMETFLYDEKNKNKILSSISNNSIPFYQFYNVDFKPEYYGYHTYKSNNFEEYPFNLKILNKTYYDIETFVDPPKMPDSLVGDRPINAIATYNTVENRAIIYYLKKVEATLTEDPEAGNIHIPKDDQVNVQERVIEKYHELCKLEKKFLIEDIDIVVKDFDDELELLVEFFNDRKLEQSLFLIGFNSSLFDDPYTLNRLIGMVGMNKAAEIVSAFGELTVNKKKYFSWPDIQLVDILSMYKPVDAGGGGFGQSLPNYKLATIAEEELGISKLDLPGGFNENYLNNLINYLTYNLVDTLLVYLLDKKLKFLELQWSINNYNKSIMSQTNAGRSLIYTTRNTLNYTMNNKLLRFKKLNREIFFPGKL